MQDRLGKGDAIQRGAGIFAWQAAQVDRRLSPFGFTVELDAGHPLQSLADVQVGNASQIVRGDAVGDLDGVALRADFVGVALAEAGHDYILRGGFCRFLGRRRVLRLAVGGARGKCRQGQREDTARNAQPHGPRNAIAAHVTLPKVAALLPLFA